MDDEVKGKEGAVCFPPASTQAANSSKEISPFPFTSASHMALWAVAAAISAGLMSWATNAAAEDKDEEAEEEEEEEEDDDAVFI